MAGKYFKLVETFIRHPPNATNFHKCLFDVSFDFITISKSFLVKNRLSRRSRPYSRTHEFPWRLHNHLNLHLTSYAYLAHSTQHMGVSVDLHLSFLAPAKVGDTIRREVYNKTNANTLVVTALHTKSFPTSMARRKCMI
uniref:4HBT domain-containing protein n=1 Tax=Rhabditophanes sp. KR3021 TaxID=114890 RepID=A0AC35TFP0_9BILA